MKTTMQTKIAALAAERNMTLKTVAEKAGISYRSLFKPPEKQNCYYKATIEAICQALEVSTEEFYADIEYTPKKRRWKKYCGRT